MLLTRPSFLLGFGELYLRILRRRYFANPNLSYRLLACCCAWTTFAVPRRRRLVSVPVEETTEKTCEIRDLGASEQGNVGMKSYPVY